MQLRNLLPTILALPFALLLATACGETSDANPTGTNPPAAHPDVHGPHDGHVVPLGTAGKLEMVHDATAGRLTLYVFAMDGKTPLPIAGVPQVKLSSTDEPLALDGVPQNSADGKSAEFVVQSEALKGKPEGRVSIELDGKVYNPELGHHDH